MALLRGYFDDSKGDGEDAYLTIAGYLAPLHVWNSFWSAWQQALDVAGMPYLHLKEFGSPNGIYAKWYNGSNEPEKIAFFQSLIKVINDAKLLPISETVRVADVTKFNKNFSVCVDSYSLTLYLCLIELSLMYPNDALEIIMDRVPRGQAKIDLARQHVKSDRYYPSANGIVNGWNITPLSKQLTFRNVLPLQAADFIAWEARKSATRRDEWFTTRKPLVPPEE
jgi:hypothetical protein